MDGHEVGGHCMISELKRRGAMALRASAFRVGLALLCSIGLAALCRAQEPEPEAPSQPAEFSAQGTEVTAEESVGIPVEQPYGSPTDQPETDSSDGQPDETLPGFRPQGVYESTGIDNVSPFTGDPGVVIPLGPAYPLGPGFTWQLKIYNTSKFWHFDTEHTCPNQTSWGCDFGPPESTYGQHAMISGYPYLGAGWTIDMGGYFGPNARGICVDPAIYHSGDGGIPRGPAAAQLRITKWLAGSNSSCASYQQNVCYTVERPDGTIYYYDHMYTAPRPVANSDPNYACPDFTDETYWETHTPGSCSPYPITRWGLGKIVDKFGNVLLTVGYDSTYPDEFTSVALTGSAGTISITWVNGAQMFGHGGCSPIWRVIDNITFPTAGGQTLKVMFTYDYGQTYPNNWMAFPRNPYDNTSQSGCPNPIDVAAPLLKEVDFTNGGSTTYKSYLMSAETVAVCNAAVLDQLTLPTGGTINYTWGETIDGGGLCEGTIGNPCGDPEIGVGYLGLQQSPTQVHADTSNWWGFLDSSPGVVYRTEKDAAGNILSNTTYSRYQFVYRNGTGSPDYFSVGRQAVVTRLSGNGSSCSGTQQTNCVVTKYLFHTSFFHANSEPDDGGVEIERRYYAEGGDGRGTPIRTIINCTTTGSADGAPLCGYKSTGNGTVPQDYNLSGNVRQQASVTWYGANPQTSNGGACTGTTTACWSSTNSSYYDNAKKYRTTTVTSNLPSMTCPNGAGTVSNCWSQRATTTYWNPYISTGASGHWLLNLFDYKSVADTYSGSASPAPSPASVTTNYTFDRSQHFGFLNAASTSGGSYNNLEHDFTIDDNKIGNPKTETIEGVGGNGGVTTTIFTRNRTFQSGLVENTNTTVGSTTLNLFDVDRDARTGQITASRDANSSLSTGYSYDAMGRLTKIDPPPNDDSTERDTRFCYLLASDNSSWNPLNLNVVLVKRGSSDNNSCLSDDSGALTFEAYQYDDLGRLVREVRMTPTLFSAPQGYNSSYFAVRDTIYDANGSGLKVSVSEWSPCVQPPSGADVSPTNIGYCLIGHDARLPLTNKTVWSNFDPFGRARLITKADQSTTTISVADSGNSGGDGCSSFAITYSDNCQKVTLKVGGSGPTNGSNSETLMFKDVLGRVYQVREPSATSGTGDDTNYDYNALDKLTMVRQVSGTTTQRRDFAFFTYGFLKSETHPEQLSGTGSTTYDSYDALGDLVSKTVGSTTYSNTYDAAGRLTKAVAGGNTFLYDCYDGATCPDSYPGYGGGSYPTGRLTRRVGFNFIPYAAAPVVEDFDYSTNGTGRLKNKITTIGNGGLGGSANALTETYSYDSLGLTYTYTHPHLTLGSAFTLTTTNTNGLPTNLAAPGQTAASSIGYNPSLGLATWTAGSAAAGMVTTIAQDTSLLPRPASITAKTSGGTQLFGTGNYTYDGSGNILQEGTIDTFGYDLRSRLTSANYGSSGSQSMTYDRFGNLTGITGTGARSLGTALATNHLNVNGSTYDERGNLTSFGSETLTFDALDRLSRTSAGWNYLFSGTGERVVKFPTVSFLVPRREMARYIVEANLQIPNPKWQLANCTGIFGDVPASDPDCKYIELMYNRGVTSGCGGGNYCPNTSTTRLNMAIFTVQGHHCETVQTGSCTYAPPSANCATFPFVDVMCPSTSANYIAQAVTDGVTNGCDATHFCPSTFVGEWNMLAFLHATSYTDWLTYMPVPRSSIFTLRDPQNRIITEATDDTTMLVNSANLVTDRENVYLGNLFIAAYDSNALGGSVQWEYYVSDHLGSPRYVLYQSGATENRKYWPYGDEVSTNPPTNQRLRFATMERDTENNHYFDHARPHDFNIGRFPSPDTVGGKPGDPQSWNRYSYARNNPLSLVDPNGLCSAPAGVGNGNIGLCVEAFIATKWLPGAPGFRGDNRGFSGVDPSLTARYQQQFLVNTQTGNVTALQPQVGISSFMVDGFGLRGTATPVLSNQFRLNGATGFTLGVTAKNGFAGAPGAPTGSIRLDLRFVVNGDGSVALSGSRTAYPSLGVYKYEAGQDPVVLNESKESSTPEDLNKAMVPVKSCVDGKAADGSTCMQ
jgi:RHS repeat-associated protein